MKSCAPASFAASMMRPIGRLGSASAMLSRTDRFGARLSSWWMMEMPRARASVEEVNSTRFPSSSTWPELGVTTPERIFISVDLPAPFSPNSVVTLPARMSKSTPRRARVLP